MKLGFTEQQVASWKDKSYYFKGTSNVAVVLVHGWTATPKQIFPIAKAINEERHTVSMPLLAGHGTKPEDLESVVAEQWIDDVRKAIEDVRNRAGVEKVLVGGVSMGGNLGMIVSLETKVDGIILIGTPVHLKNHVWVWIGSKIVPMFVKYGKKGYPKMVPNNELRKTTYQYFPTINVRQCLKIIKKATYSLKKITAPILVLQTSSDSVVAKYSPWVIFNSVKSEIKKLQWIKSKNNNHVMNTTEVSDSIFVIKNFIEEIKKR
ncbi:MAG: alpha/beta fold hydrolase [Patescibacteria group bacterium]|nr:alpha/beta fold hydrolase [Patescibacteria group bacterium]